MSKVFGAAILTDNRATRRNYLTATSFAIYTAWTGLGSIPDLRCVELSCSLTLPERSSCNFRVYLYYFLQDCTKTNGPRMAQTLQVNCCVLYIHIYIYYMI